MTLGEPKKISLRTLSASSTGSPVKPSSVHVRSENHSEYSEEELSEPAAPQQWQQASPSQPMVSPPSHPVAAPIPPPAPTSDLAPILPSTTAAVTPGTIASQIHNRHRHRQPIQKRVNRPKKAKKVRAGLRQKKGRQRHLLINSK